MLITRLRRWGRLGIAALAVSAAVALTACSGPAGVKQGDDGGGGEKSDPLKVAFITHAPPGDTFWDIVRAGAEKAASELNIELLYSNDEDGARQAQLVQQAIDKSVDAIVVTLAKPEAMSGPVKDAVAAGIPVFSLNSGEDQYKDMGVLAHFGQNDRVAGEAAGEKLNELGATNMICVIQVQGHIGLENRCDGVDETFEGEFERLYVQGTDMNNVASTITAKLQTGSDIDYVLTLGAPFAMTAIDSIADAGSDAKLATFDLNAEAIKALQDGDIQFLVDQQPYLQGYLAVSSARLYHDNGNVMGGGKPVLTGPQIITQENAESIAEFAKNGTR
ncbi:sugar ABC transporter substrate-binding protein [Paramicrobacterium fandaimingii]|uniref:sugar ABC transporter substrate-binding protein n=1 Tax=Paramicrobacterium fandaimingii TaxID=2708079 RepID=UPI0014209048|nr:sugar ABC transporter substrate-binding protein [Microbacterium fandaimingii]